MLSPFLRCESRPTGLQSAFFRNFHSEEGQPAYEQEFEWNIGRLTDPAALMTAWREATARHDSFYFTAHADPANPYLVWHEQPQVVLKVVDLSGFASGDQEQRRGIQYEQHRREGIDPVHGPLTRISILLEPGQRARVLWTSHHAVFDGRSRALIIREVIARYRAATGQTALSGFSMDGAAGSFRDYLEERPRQPDSEAERFWRDQLKGLDAAVAPVWKAGDPNMPSAVRIDRLERFLPDDLRDAILSRSEEWQLTPNSFFQAAWAILLHRLQGHDTVCFGAPRACRRGEPSVANLVGCVLNVVPVVVTLCPGMRVGELLQKLRENWISMRPFERFEIDPAAFGIHGALYQSLLGCENGDPRHPSWSLEPDAADSTSLRAHTNLPLTGQFFCSERMRMEIVVHTRFMDGEGLALLAESLIHLLRQLTQATDQPLVKLGLCSPQMADASLQSGPRAGEWQRWHSVVERFAHVVAAHPDRIALVTPTQSLSYAELHQRSDRLAAWMCARADLKPGDRVAVIHQRSLFSPVVYLAILKAGGIYVPLDPKEPAARLELLLRDAAPRLLLSEFDLPFTIESGLRLDLSQCLGEAEGCELAPPENHLNPDSPAYLNFTSGTTGEPKAVAVCHRGILRLVLDCDYADLSPGRRILHTATLNFDAVTFELWGALLNGGSCVINDVAEMDLDRLQNLLSQHAVQSAFLTTALFNLIARERPLLLAPLDELLVGGEAINPECCHLVQQAIPHLRLSNVYGPTEVTTFSLREVIPQSSHAPVAIAIGKPINATCACVLDPYGHPVPDGVAGELYLGGDGLAIGYWNREKLTAERFPILTQEPCAGQRFYRTGDRVRRTVDGRVYFLGRLDSQVKLRGFRIELEEIRTQLNSVPGVADSYIHFDNESLDKRIVAYWIAQAGAAPTAGILREHLRSRLPAPMVPGQFVAVDAFPLKRNGKVDTRRLPAVPVAVVDPLEDSHRAEFRQLWDRIHAAPLVWGHSYYECGGHSLAALRFLDAIKRKWQIDLSLEEFFQMVTIEDLYQRCVPSGEQSMIGEPLPILDLPDVVSLMIDGKRAYPATAHMKKRFLRWQQSGGATSGTITRAFHIVGNLDPVLLREAFQRLIDAHDLLRMTLREIDGTLLQVIEPKAELEWNVEDLTAMHAHARYSALECALMEHAQSKGEIRPAPMMDVRLIRLESNHWVFSLTISHLLVDGTALHRLFTDLATGYNSLQAGRTFAPVPDPVGFHLECAARAQWLESPHGDALREHWARLGPKLGFFKLPFSTQKTVPINAPGRMRYWLPDESLNEQFFAASRKAAVSPVCLFLTCWEILLSHYVADEGFAIGLVTNARMNPQDTPTYGDLTGNIFLQCQSRGSLTLDQVLLRTKSAFAEALQFRLTRVADLPRCIDQGTSMNDHASLGFLIVEDFQERAPLDLDGLQVDPILRRDRFVAYRLQCTLNRSANQFSFSLAYAPDFYPEESAIDRLVVNFEYVLMRLMQNPDMRVDELGPALFSVPLTTPVSETEKSQSKLREI